MSSGQTWAAVDNHRKAEQARRKRLLDQARAELAPGGDKPMRVIEADLARLKADFLRRDSERRAA